MKNEKTLEMGFYGRKKGKALRPQQQQRQQDLLPKLKVPFEKGPVDMATVFGKSYAGYGLEIGFGGGEHLAWQAQQNPQWGFIGVEPFINGVVALLGKIEASGISNIRIYDDNVRPELEKLPSAAFDVVYILFPDPWPKKRHHKRRIVCDFVLDHVARLLKKGGELRLASDIEDYVTWMIERVERRKDFAWADGSGPLFERPADWPPTRYEEKAIREGRRGQYLLFTRL